MSVGVSGQRIDLAEERKRKGGRMEGLVGVWWTPTAHQIFVLISHVNDDVGMQHAGRYPRSTSGRHGRPASTARLLDEIYLIS